MSSAQNRQARLLEEVLKLPGNNVCADCRAMAPRWASTNLGIFICVQCASVHRKLGTHLSRVKSCTMDSWTREQVDTMRQLGNSHQNAIYNPDPSRHPPPTSTAEFNDRDSELEKYIRKKWVTKAFMPSSQASSSNGGGLHAPSPGRPRANTTTESGSRGSKNPHGLDQRNARHQELNDIVVPVARGREELPPPPPSRSPVFNGSGMLKDDRTGSSSGSKEPRRRPSPGGGMGSYTAAGGFGGTESGAQLGSGTAVATRNHVDSNWADLLGMEAGSGTGLLGTAARSAPPTPRRVTSPNPPISQPGQIRGPSQTASVAYANVNLGQPNPAFPSPQSTPNGQFLSSGQAMAPGYTNGSNHQMGASAFGPGHAHSNTGQAQSPIPNPYAQAPFVQSLPYNPFQNQQTLVNAGVAQYPGSNIQAGQAANPFPLAQSLYSQQSPFPLAQTPTPFNLSIGNSYFSRAAGQSTPLPVTTPGQISGGAGYFGQGQGQMQGQRFGGGDGFANGSSQAMGQGAFGTQQSQYPLQQSQQQIQQQQLANGFGVTNTQYSGMMMPAGWGVRR